MKRWLHQKFNNSFETKIKIDVLSKFNQYQKANEFFMNHTPRLLDKLPFHKKDKVHTALNELKSCGYIGGSDTITSPHHIIEEGKVLLKEYNQFLNKGILSKVTWWYHNKFKGMWKLLWLIFFQLECS